VEIKLHSFSTSAIGGGERSVSAPGSIIAGNSQNPLKGRVDGRRSSSKCFGEEQSFASAGIRTPDCPARNIQCVRKDKLRWSLNPTSAKLRHDWSYSTARPSNLRGVHRDKLKMLILQIK
jgi:hypothetical protein